ncbi:MAG: response regulator [Acidimicrobiia bacterium]|nr:response regulator [Acidimicrobiia bacterium]
MTDESARKRHHLMPDLLLVEDNPLHLRLVKSMLADVWPPNEVAEVRHARSLEEAIDAIKADPPACVLLDLVLPDADGMDSLIGVRNADPLVPIVVLSSHEDAEVARNAISRGAQDYLVKGAVSPDDLEKSVAFAMGRKDHERQKVADTPGITPWPMNQPGAGGPEANETAATHPVPTAPLDVNNSVGVAVIDEGHLIFMEPAVADALGRSLEEVASLAIEELIHPNDLVDWKKLSAGDPGPADVRFMHPSGHPLYFRINARHMAALGDSDGAVVASFTARNEEGTVSTGAYVVMSDWG